MAVAALAGGAVTAAAASEREVGTAEVEKGASVALGVGIVARVEASSAAGGVGTTARAAAAAKTALTATGVAAAGTGRSATALPQGVRVVATGGRG